MINRRIRWTEKHYWGMMVLLISIGMSCCENRPNSLYFSLSDAKGLKKDDPVKVDGKIAGKVGEMTLLRNEILTEVILEENIQIPKEFILRICPINLLGEVEMELTDGNAAKGYLALEDTVHMAVLDCEGSEDVEIGENLQQVIELIGDLLE